jgi:hypothetical protein
MYEVSIQMCATCGCGILEEKHGDERNINWSQIEDAAKAAGTDTDTAVQNIEKMAKHEHQH